jgi:hypothetical protein
MCGSSQTRCPSSFLEHGTSFAAQFQPLWFCGSAVSGTV